MVPNKNYRLRPYGNEDLLTKEEWENILSDFNIIESYDIQKSKSNSQGNPCRVRGKPIDGGFLSSTKRFSQPRDIIVKKITENNLKNYKKKCYKIKSYIKFHPRVSKLLKATFVC